MIVRMADVLTASVNQYGKVAEDIVMGQILYLPRTQQDFCRYSFIPEANNQLPRRKCLQRQCRE